MGRACSVHGGDEKLVATKFLLGSLKGTDYLEDLGVDGRILLKRILEKNNVGRCGFDSYVSG
jgi:hypothetical protein